MRTLGLMAATCLFGLASSSAMAQVNGLSEGQIRYYCSLGSQTPISVRPYCGGYRGGYRPSRQPPPEYGYGYETQRELSPRELRYYCSLGDQTPVSARADCVRYGFWR